jgi:arylsulfatase A-like enzyme
MPASMPNIVLILADNLGWGELGCYGGGILRGAPTPCLDRLAETGLRLLNFNIESDCVPTRSALMTGRHPIRTGAMQSIEAGLPQGLVPWEVTLADLLSARGYATAHFGKWHLGDLEPRLPTNRGFDEWYGISRTTNESMFVDAPGFDPSVVPVPYVMEGIKNEPSRNIAVYDLEMRRRIDGDLTLRTIDFIGRQRRAGRPYFAYVPLTQLHFPTIPHRDFIGRTGAGDFSDSLAEMDHRVGQIVDAIDDDPDTLIIFASDNGPEFRNPWRGTAGPWTGTYHTAMEGGLRAPFIARWPGRISGGRTSNEIVHVTDLFTTLARIAGAQIPTDRPIDGVDQLDFLLGAQEKSSREGFVFFIKNELRAAKWRNWKLHFVWEVEPNAGPKRLESPYLFDLLRDPKEETDVHAHPGWARRPIQEMIRKLQASLAAHPPIPPGAPDDYRPRQTAK